jgi:hypothetical protein
LKLRSSSGSSVTMMPPSTGPNRLLMPPRIVMVRISTPRSKPNSCGPMKLVRWALSTPARPAMAAPSAKASILWPLTSMPIRPAAVSSSLIASNARPIFERRSRASTNSTTTTASSTCHHCVSCGMPSRPPAPPVIFSARMTIRRTTSPNASVAMAR